MKSSRYWFLMTGLLIVSALNAWAQVKKGAVPPKKQEFSMVFMTDIHLQPELNAVLGFRQAMDSINKLKPDFVVTGGDLVMDALAQRQSRADSLFTLYKSEIKRLRMPVYNSIGNHEYFGMYPASGVDSTNELYGIKMFNRQIGDASYSFDYHGWKFIMLNSIEFNKDHKYFGHISQDQLDRVKKELESVSPGTPLVVVVHIPMLTSLTQFESGAMAPNGEGLVISNSREVLDVFKGYNLRMVLQGHLHILEDNFIQNIHFITGGAICGGWWKGPNKGTQEGFLYLTFKGQDIHWQYVDYGWNPETTIKK